jgi:hypothetical protein
LVGRPGVLNVQDNGRAEMDDSGNSDAVRNRRLMLAAVGTLALLIGAVAYGNSDRLIDLARSLTSAQNGRAQSRVHY